MRQKKVEPYVDRPKDADPYSDVNPFYATGNHLIATSVTQDQGFKSPSKAEAARSSFTPDIRDRYAYTINNKKNPFSSLDDSFGKTNKTAQSGKQDKHVPNTIHSSTKDGNQSNKKNIYKQT